MRKKYTIFYIDHWMSGCHHQVLPKVAFVKTSDIKKLIAKEYDSAFYIIKGHHKSV